MKFSIFCSFFLMACYGQGYHVRSAIHLNASNQKYLIGPVIARDYRTPKTVALDFRELYIFELMQNGVSIINHSSQPVKREVEIRNERSSLPSSLRSSAGESNQIQFASERLLEKADIQSLFESNHFDYFIQGIYSIHAGDMVSPEKQNHLIFLNVFDHEGNILKMIHSQSVRDSLKESEQLRTVAAALAKNTREVPNK
ncbi:hypothetical protein EHQ58_05290 [Leptospira ognonensis]|uniref:Uncharacterized protein n=1 Tax=Leptospira ognonensis TaxID=2484945 RepID=A0A4R9K6L2_9LEPT|nr:hypothetical protein [Leptospira ognonensis]TGL61196.1 hypothetical protein EHQ58_05290 [Leptospira ognonensis]